MGDREDRLTEWLEGAFDLFGVPPRDADLTGQHGPADWDVWLGCEVGGLCDLCGAEGTAVMLTDAAQPAVRLSVLALCQAHADPRRWMARQWRQLRDGAVEGGGIRLGRAVETPLH